MRSLYQKFGGDKERACNAFAEAELRGEITRRRTAGNNSAKQYAADLWSDGIRKGWLIREGLSSPLPAK